MEKKYPKFKQGKKVVFMLKRESINFPVYSEVETIIHSNIEGFLYRLPGMDGAIPESDLRDPTDEEWSNFFL